MKKWINLMVTILLFFGGLFVAEVSIRLIETKTKNISFSRSPYDYFDPVLGWRGKNVFGDINTEKYKIYIVGDSMSLGIFVDENNLYYRQLEKFFDCEIFASAGGGYGTLQEYLILKENINKINPDLIIIQTTSNDFVNNDYEVEKRSFFNNNTLMRPYLINNKIVMKYPTLLGKFRYTLQINSRLIMRLFERSDKFISKLAINNYILKSSEQRNDQYMIDQYKRSKETTEKILKMMLSLSSNSKFIIVQSDYDELSLSFFRDFSLINNIDYLEKAAARLENDKSNNFNVMGPDNSHWNMLGNELFGKYMVEEIIEKNIIPNKYKID